MSGCDEMQWVSMARVDSCGPGVLVRWMQTGVQRFAGHIVSDRPTTKFTVPHTDVWKMSPSLFTPAMENTLEMGGGEG